MRIRTLSVTEVNRYIGRLVEGDPILNALAVRGEISNFKVYASGHAYFNLKDEGGKLPCVMFKNAFSQIGFTPEDGSLVIARGHMAVYERDGRYQLMVHHLEQEGEGTLYLAFLKMKQELLQKGYFDTDRKKPLPEVMRVGVVTSPDGAAIQDFLTVLRRRNPMVSVVIYPSRVQGAEAVGELVAGIEWFNRQANVDVIVLTRGGGSIEELWAYNEAPIAEAVFASRLPIVSAVGHETDTTICDYVSDLRAPTPSAAAEMIAAPISDAYAALSTLKERMAKGLKQKGQLSRAALDAHRPEQLALRLSHRIEQQRLLLDHHHSRMATAVSYRVETLRQQIKHFEKTLRLHHPQGILDKGFVYVQEEGGSVITSANQVKQKKTYLVNFKDGQVPMTVKRSTP